MPDPKLQNNSEKSAYQNSAAQGDAAVEGPNVNRTDTEPDRSVETPSRADTAPAAEASVGENVRSGRVVWYNLPGQSDALEPASPVPEVVLAPRDAPPLKVEVNKAAPLPPMTNTTVDTPPAVDQPFYSNGRHVFELVLRYGRFAARYAAIGLASWFAAMVVLIVVFSFVRPPGSALMAIRWAQGMENKQDWVDIEQISPHLVRAVIASEDGRFCKHWGVDPHEVYAAIKRARDGRPRGASTITMQLAKNLFLWPSQSYVRKALEVPLTFAIELFWSKRRIMEVYLNVVEWGPGVFGAQTAARRHFRTSAKKLSSSQAALLAVSLPAPLRRKARKPSRGMRRMAGVVKARMRRNRAATRCVLRSGT